MATDSNDSDPQLPDDTRLHQDDRAAHQAVLGEGRVTIDGGSDYALRRASGKTDSSDSSSVVSYCRPVQIMAENEVLKRQIKDAEERRLSDWKDVEERANQRIQEAEERADRRAEQRLQDAIQRLQDAEQRRLSDLKNAEERRLSDLKNAEQRLQDAEQRLQDAEQRRLSDLKEAERRLQDAEGRAERLLNTILSEKNVTRPSRRPSQE